MSLILLAGIPAYTPDTSKLLVTTLPAAMTTLSAIVTPGRMITLAPVADTQFV